MDTPFASLPIVDGHVHFVHPERMDEILALMDAVPCARFHLVCVPNRDGSTHNPAALYFKERHPDRTYISGALDYRAALADAAEAPSRLTSRNGGRDGASKRGAESLARQVRELKARGFDGLKLIEGKPEVRKLLPYPLDGPLYAAMWAALEREQFPVVCHVADPDIFWDRARCPNWARQKGWDYSDGSYPAKDDLYAEVAAILGRHPRLKITFAHFYFLSADLRRAARFLDDHPTVCFDLAPHMEMYRDFSQTPGAARDFFLRYQDRIIYGTDVDTRVLQGASDEAPSRLTPRNGGRDGASDGYRFLLSIPWLIRSLLEKDGPFAMPDGQRYHGLGLPLEALQKIYAGNFERMYGAPPAPLRS